jgi:hypothetical protein
MTTLREAAQIALDVLDDINQCSLPPTGIPLPAEIDEAMDSLRAALAQPQREWVGLTARERVEIGKNLPLHHSPLDLAKAIEAKLREKNFDRPS